MQQHDTPQARRALAAFFALAYGISWSVGVPLALARQGVIPPVLPAWTHYLVGYGPLLAALAVTAMTEGRAGLAALGRRLAAWRVAPAWWAAALSPLLAALILVPAIGALGGPRIGPADLGEVNFLPPLGLAALPLWLLTFGLGEEVGWRGFALPRLQRGRGALRATAILSALWALWHLPQFFYVLDPAYAVGWALGLFAGAVVFTWLVNGSGGSLLLPVVFHGCFNFVSASPAGGGLLAAVVSAGVMIWAVAAVAIFRPRDLAARPRFTG